MQIIPKGLLTSFHYAANLTASNINESITTLNSVIKALRTVGKSLALIFSADDWRNQIFPHYAYCSCMGSLLNPFSTSNSYT